MKSRILQGGARVLYFLTMTPEQQGEAVGEGLVRLIVFVVFLVMGLGWILSKIHWKGMYQLPDHLKAAQNPGDDDPSRSGRPRL
jgi:hypothetical protein